MSVLSMSNFIFDDLLSEYNMKPWWEKVRGYGSAACLASSLFLVYTLFPGPSLNCLPALENGTVEVREISIPEANFVNSFCSHQVQFPTLYNGFITLVFCAIILVASSYWLYMPGVIDAFQTFSKWEEKLEKIEKPMEKLLSISRDTWKPFEFIWKHKADTDIKRLYLVRNQILLVTNIVIFLATMSLLLATSLGRKILNCNILESMPNITRQKYSCSHNTIERTIPFLVAYLLGVILQIIFIFMGIRTVAKQLHAKQKHRQSQNQWTERWRKVVHYLDIMGILWRNSRPSNSGEFENFCDMIARSSWRRINNHLETISDFDLFFLEVYSIVGIPDWKTVGKRVLNLGPAAHSSVVRDTQTRILFNLSIISWDDDIKEILEELIQRGDWGRVAPILSLRPSTKETEIQIEKFLKRRYLNSDTTMRETETRKILYYALFKRADGEHSLTAAKRILQCFCGCEKKFVQCKGSLVSAVEFAQQQEMTGSDLQKIKKFIHDSEDPYVKIQQLSDDLSGSEPSPDKDSEIAETISWIKFPEWTKVVNNFAEQLHKIKYTKSLVTLMNSFNPEEVKNKNLEKIAKCDIKDFVVDAREEVPPWAPQPHEQNNLWDPKTNEGFRTTGYGNHPWDSLLYHALTQRVSPNLTECRLTAIKHILACTRGKKKMVRCSPHEDPITAVEFVKQCRITDTDITPVKELLIKLIEESEEPQLSRQTSAESPKPSPSHSDDEVPDLNANPSDPLLGSKTQESSKAGCTSSVTIESEIQVKKRNRRSGATNSDKTSKTSQQNITGV